MIGSLLSSIDEADDSRLLKKAGLRASAQVCLIWLIFVRPLEGVFLASMFRGTMATDGFPVDWAARKLKQSGDITSKPKKMMKKTNQTRTKKIRRK
jgi:hypothetical protein